MKSPHTRLALEILPQPDDSTCGPTCLHAVYRFFGGEIALDKLVAEVELVEGGGTLAVNLARHALRRGWAATIYTYNLQLFDPSWFAGPDVDVADRLRAQAAAKRSRRLRAATESYLDYLALGGRIQHEELNAELLRRLLADGPVITGLSATYLYGCARERSDPRLVEDDVRGVPTGHFVVLTEYDPERRQVLVADPLEDRPGFESHLYTVGVDRVLGAILLGVLTYDANLAVLRPAAAGRSR